MHPLLKNYFRFIKRFIPVKQDSASVGLDIGSGECKLVEVRKNNEEFELVNWSIEPILNGDVSAAVKKSLEKIKNPCTSLYTAVFGKGTLIRYIDMPRMSITELKNSFSIEADKYFPFAHDQIYTDCYILDPEKKEKQMAVIAAAAKKEIVDQRIKLLTDLGLPANFVGIGPIAMSNAFNVLGDMPDINQNAAVAILDMGDSVSSLTILIDRVPRFTRDIFIGGKEFTRRISNALGVSPQDADRLKKQPGDKVNDVMSACETAVMSIVQELKLSFDYFTTEKNKEIGTLLLTGGSSLLQGVDKLLEKNLEVKVILWNPLNSLKLGETIKTQDINHNSHKLGVALGLALYEYD
jgi:type IV pilus assembly protein PilM